MSNFSSSFHCPRHEGYTTEIDLDPLSDEAFLLVPRKTPSQPTLFVFCTAQGHKGGYGGSPPRKTNHAQRSAKGGWGVRLLETKAFSMSDTVEIDEVV